MKKTALFITLLFCGFDFAVAAETLPANGVQANTIKITTRPEILGLWGMDIPGNKKCVEYYNFRGGNEVVVNSGKEWSAGLYDYQPSPDNTLEKWPALVMQIKYENNEKDCSGNQVDQSGEVSQYYVRWKNNSTLNFCASEADDKCFATLRRVLP
ncbi:hypothetical protein ACK2M2_10700 [Acinetobacter sp. TY1]|uniref:hypothetical protein n=1 Tax=Acinetobacter sp. TY1 TaxID=3387626 RepID=UPI003AF84F52